MSSCSHSKAHGRARSNNTLFTSSPTCPRLVPSSTAQACEQGFEVHVIVLSLQGAWENADHLLWPTPTRYHCLRLQRLLPVALHVTPFGNGLQMHRHRPLFASLIDKYDLFLSQVRGHWRGD